MGTKYQGSAEEVRALNAFIKLTRASNSVLDRTNRHITAAGLTTSQFGVLEALYHIGTLSQVEMARKLLLSTANITTVIQNLEKRGLVCRDRSPEDNRVMRVNLTDEGRALVERLLPHHVAGITAELSVLTAEEQETLAALCRKLGLGT